MKTKEFLFLESNPWKQRWPSPKPVGRPSLSPDHARRTFAFCARRSVAIASALLHDPEVFVIDEPMVGLDPHHARVVKDTLKERSRRGMTVFLSTHQLSVAEEIADRIGIIHQGRLVAVGTRDELRTQSEIGRAHV